MSEIQEVLLLHLLQFPLFSMKQPTNEQQKGLIHQHPFTPTLSPKLSDTMQCSRVIMRPPGCLTECELCICMSRFSSTAVRRFASAAVASLHLKTNTPPEQQGISPGWGCLPEIPLELNVVHQCSNSFRAIVACKSLCPLHFLNDNCIFFYFT